MINLFSLVTNFFSAGLYYLVKPSHVALSQPPPQRPRGWAAGNAKRHATGLATNPTMVVFYAGWFISCQPSVCTIPM